MKFLNNFLFNFNITENLQNQNLHQKLFHLIPNITYFNYKLKFWLFKRFQLKNFEFRLLNFFFQNWEFLLCICHSPNEYGNCPKLPILHMTVPQVTSPCMIVRDWEINSIMAALCGKWDYESEENLEEYIDKSGIIYFYKFPLFWF